MKQKERKIKAFLLTIKCFLTAKRKITEGSTTLPGNFTTGTSSYIHTCIVTVRVALSPARRVRRYFRPGGGLGSPRLPPVDLGTL